MGRLVFQHEHDVLVFQHEPYNLDSAPTNGRLTTGIYPRLCPYGYNLVEEAAGLLPGAAPVFRKRLQNTVSCYPTQRSTEGCHE